MFLILFFYELFEVLSYEKKILGMKVGEKGAKNIFQRCLREESLYLCETQISSKCRRRVDDDKCHKDTKNSVAPQFFSWTML